MNPSALAQDKPRELGRLRGFTSVRFHFDPTPAGLPQGGTLLSASGPCLSPASWAALQMFSVPPLQ
ncbi:hypothetical protein ACTRXD_18325 [Nitrospira sp. T9]|uniref:hypothetical protein n=1 Tax=unclassified Nitrospira TaxID=2652172 RepID=UPI003F951263